MCQRYAQLETKLGEVDRARSLYSHGSQFSDPRVSAGAILQEYSFILSLIFLLPSLPPFLPSSLSFQTTKSYWKAWQEFEVRFGNEDTFREMLRIKRSVQAQFNTQVNLMSAQMLAAASKEVQVTGQQEQLTPLKATVLCVSFHFTFFWRPSLQGKVWTR